MYSLVRVEVAAFVYWMLPSIFLNSLLKPFAGVLKYMFRDLLSGFGLLSLRSIIRLESPTIVLSVSCTMSVLMLPLMLFISSLTGILKKCRPLWSGFMSNSLMGSSALSVTKKSRNASFVSGFVNWQKEKSLLAQKDMAASLCCMHHFSSSWAMILL